MSLVFRNALIPSENQQLLRLRLKYFMIRNFLAVLIFILFSPIQVISSGQYTLDDISIQISEDLIPLLDLLHNKGFKVYFQNPPKKGVYGLFNSKSKIIWISPISFELGIGRQTLLHEATHAAQSCPYGSLTPVGWELPITPFIKKEIQAILINRYPSKKYIFEKEALSLQGQKNAVSLLLKAISQRCK